MSTPNGPDRDTSEPPTPERVPQQDGNDLEGDTSPQRNSYYSDFMHGVRRGLRFFSQIRFGNNAAFRGMLAEYRAQTPLTRVGTVCSLLGGATALVAIVSWVLLLAGVRTTDANRLELASAIRAAFPDAIDEQINSAVEAIGSALSSTVVAAARAGDTQPAEAKLANDLEALRRKSAPLAEIAEATIALAAVTSLRDPQGAVQLFLEATRVAPEDERAWFGVGYAAIGAGMYEQATSAFEVTKRLGTDKNKPEWSALSGMYLGDALADSWIWDRALEEYQGALRATESLPSTLAVPRVYLMSELRYRLGQVLLILERYDEGTAHLFAAISIAEANLVSASIDSWVRDAALETQALSYLKVGAITGRGDTLAAIEYFDEALTRLGRITHGSRVARRAAANASLLRTTLLWFNGDRSDVIPTLERALEDATALEREPNATPADRAEDYDLLAQIHLSLMIVYGELGSLDSAVAHGSEALRMRRLNVSANARASDSDLNQLAQTHAEFARILSKRRDLAGAQDNLQSAVTIQERLAARSDGAPDRLRALADTYWALSDVAESASDVGTAHAYGQQAVAAMDDAATQQADERFSIEAIRAHVRLAMLFERTGALHDAVDEHSYVIAAMDARAFVREDASLALITFNALSSLGALHLTNRNTIAAEATLMRCVQDLADLPREAHSFSVVGLAQSCRVELAKLAISMDRYDLALRELDEALRVIGETEDTPDDSFRRRATIADLTLMKAEVLYASDNKAESLKLISDATQRLRALRAEDPAASEIATLLASAESALYALQRELSE